MQDFLPKIQQALQWLTTHLPVFWAWFKTIGWKWLIAVVAGWYLFKVVLSLARFIYAHYSAKNLVYMKVILPRSDSKADQEKRTEKDFKEKGGGYGSILQGDLRNKRDESVEYG